MSQSTTIKSAFDELATNIRALQDEKGQNSTLTTADKATLVGAINEVKAALDTLANSTVIDDAATGADVTLSAAEIISRLETLREDILGGAGAAFDTLQELQVFAEANEGAAASLAAAQVKRVRVDAAQPFTPVEQAQGRDNIGAAAAADLTALETAIGDPGVDYHASVLAILNA